MTTFNIKNILFSLLAIMAIAIFMTSCEQESLVDIPEQIDTNFEEGHTCSDCMLYSTDEPDEIVDVLIQYDEDSDPVYEKAARYGEVIVYGGDVVLTQNYSDDIASRGAIISNFSRLWPNGTMPYTWGSGLSYSKKTQILNAIEAINTQANLCIVERTNETAYVEFRNNGGGCYVTQVGNSGTAKQTIHIGNDCYERQIIHEILHKAGLYHEQNRSDRDNFISVNWNNIKPSWRSQFNPRGVESSSGDYDFASIMHYQQYHSSLAVNSSQPLFFINSGVSLPAGMSSSYIGRVNNMSDGDIASVNTLYSVCGSGGGSSACDTPAVSEITYGDRDYLIYLYAYGYHGVSHQFRYRENGGAWIELPATSNYYSTITNVQANASYEVQLKLCDDNWSDSKIIRDNSSCNAPTASEIRYGEGSYYLYLYAYNYSGVRHQFRYRVNGGSWVELSVTTDYYNMITNKQSCATYEIQLKEDCSTWSDSKVISTGC